MSCRQTAGQYRIGLPENGRTGIFGLDVLGLDGERPRGDGQQAVRHPHGVLLGHVESVGVLDFDL